MSSLLKRYLGSRNVRAVVALLLIALAFEGSGAVVHGRFDVESWRRALALCIAIIPSAIALAILFGGWLRSRKRT